MVESILCQVTEYDPDVLESLIGLAVEIAREGREGRRVGTLFTLGDESAVFAKSRPLILDPLSGHPESSLHVTKLNLLVINLRRGAQGEVLHQKKVNFVPVRIALFRFPQVPADERAQACFAGVQRSHLQEMTKLVGHHFLVHGVQPFVYLVEELNVGFLREVPLALRKGNVDFRLLRKRHVNWEDLARLFPLRKARALRACRRRDI